MSFLLLRLRKYYAAVRIWAGYCSDLFCLVLAWLLKEDCTRVRVPDACVSAVVAYPIWFVFLAVRYFSWAVEGG